MHHSKRMLSPKEAVVYTFNKFFYDLIEDIQTAGDEELTKKIKESYKVKNLNTSKNIHHFTLTLAEDVQHLIVHTKPSDILVSDIVKGFAVIKNVTIGAVIDVLGLDNVVTLKSYIYNLTLMKVLYDFMNKDGVDDDDAEAMFNHVMLVLKKIQKREDVITSLDDIYDDEIKILLQHIDAVTAECPEEEPTDNEGGMDGNIPPIPQLEGTKIGNMAKEISEELDMSNIKIEKPEDVMKLITGDALGNIIGKVGSKIQEKISTGEVKREELMSEAFNMMGMLNNPMFKDILKGTNMRVDPSKLRTLSTRDRLKKKLDEKKKSTSNH